MAGAKEGAQGVREEELGGRGHAKRGPHLGRFIITLTTSSTPPTFPAT
jgi:hypothetical protein